jgi:hypothetical protein
MAETIERTEYRTGTEWMTFLAKYRIRNITDAADGWTINSQSGAVYHVTRTMHSTRDDGGYSFRFNCNCPARKRCRHIDAVEQMLHAEAHADIAAGDDGGIDDMEILERSY